MALTLASRGVPTGLSSTAVWPSNLVVRIGRDYGDHLEVLSVLDEGTMIIAYLATTRREGVKVQPIPAAKKNWSQTNPPSQNAAKVGRPKWLGMN